MTSVTAKGEPGALRCAVDLTGVAGRRGGSSGRRCRHGGAERKRLHAGM